jgi:hypothetical protein
MASNVPYQSVESRIIIKRGDIQTFWTHETELTVSFEAARSHSFETAALCAVHRYTQLPNPTPSTFVLLQSTRLR